MRWSWLSAGCWLLAAALCLPLAGCGGSKLNTISVSGQVTYGGGDWPKPGTLTFTAKKTGEKQSLHPGSASFDVDGHFTVKSSGQGGLVPGEYKATVQCWEVEPSMAGGGKSYAPDEYLSADTSPLTLKIEEGAGAQKVEWDVPKR